MKNSEIQTNRMSSERRTIFVTGGTGNIGAVVVARLLKQDRSARLILLVRGRSNVLARQRVENTIRFLTPELDWLSVADRITVLAGDITQKNLGLSRSDWLSVACQITEIVHCAAATKFLLPLKCARSINVAGTANVLELAQAARNHGGLRQMVHVSTAFVCGDRSGIIYEDDPVRPNSFSNSYEQTKWEGEQLVRMHMEGLPVSIVRPSVVVGDSRTGRTTAFNVLYTPLRLIHEGRLTRIPCVPDTKLDVVPLDYVADALVHMALNHQDTVGRTFHLVAGQGQTLSVKAIVLRALEIYRQSGSLDHSAGVKFISPTLYRIARLLVRGRTRRLRQLAEPYQPYISTKKCFDNTNTRKLLSGTAISPPPLASYLDTILNYAVQTDWGKHPTAAPCAA